MGLSPLLQDQVWQNDLTVLIDFLQVMKSSAVLVHVKNRFGFIPTFVSPIATKHTLMISQHALTLFRRL